MSPQRLLQVWIAGVVLGAALVLTGWDLVETGGSRLSGNVAPFLLVVVSLSLAFSAAYWAPRPDDKPDSAKDDDDSLSFR